MPAGWARVEWQTPPTSQTQHTPGPASSCPASSCPPFFSSLDAPHACTLRACLQAGSLVTYGGNRADLVFCADQAAGDYALSFGSVQQRTPDCPWYPNGCRYQARVIIRCAAGAGPPLRHWRRSCFRSLCMI